jgi:OOP family OmpA-OmpF porin
VGFVKNRIVVRRPVSFRMPGGKPTADLTPASQQTLDALADVMSAHPEIKKVRVEAHWDNGLEKPQANELTQQQADAVASYLARKGVPSGRVQAVGMGSNRPRVPNLTPASRSKNRRVEFATVN